MERLDGSVKGLGIGSNGSTGASGSGNGIAGRNGLIALQVRMRMNVARLLKVDLEINNFFMVSVRALYLDSKGMSRLKVCMITSVSLEHIAALTFSCSD